MGMLLDPRVRGHGYGRYLGVLLAAPLLPDAQFLLGTIHVDNIARYRAALGSGRRYVGGDITVPLRSWPADGRSSALPLRTGNPWRAPLSAGRRGVDRARGDEADVDQMAATQWLLQRDGARVGEADTEAGGVA